MTAESRSRCLDLVWARLRGLNRSMEKFAEFAFIGMAHVMASSADVLHDDPLNKVFVQSSTSYSVAQ